MTESKPRTVLFVCTGNYYRSRLAELLFNHYASTETFDWRADSRGLLEQTSYQGLSPSAVRYLEERELGELLQNPRKPSPIRLDDLEKADLSIGLSRVEHESMFLTRFGQIPRHMEKQGKLRYWNVADLPRPGSRIASLFKTLFNGKEAPPTQREESGTEHIDFAVQALVRELAQKENTKTTTETSE
jgi:protein-tyrosine phosphatase